MTDPYNSSPLTAATPLLDRTMVTTALELPGTVVRENLGVNGSR